MIDFSIVALVAIMAVPLTGLLMLPHMVERSTHPVPVQSGRKF